MLRFCAAVAVLGVMLGGLAHADKIFATRAIVVACDSKAKTITVKHTDDKGAWQQTVATWDAKTAWERGDTPQTQYDPKPATASLAEELKKDSKVYITINDRGRTTFWVEKVRLLSPNTEVK